MTRILVVDDEVGVCCVLQHVLIRAGYAVTAITDGRAAIEAIRQDDYAVALIDLNLGEFDGNEVIRAARAAKPDMPVVMMSGMVLESGRGAPDFLGMSVKVRGLYRLAKPFKPKDLIQLIENVLTHPSAPIPFPEAPVIASRL